MSRWNRNSDRERKVEEQKNPANNNDRNSRRDTRFNNRERSDRNHISGLNRYRLNDLYERSSL